MPPFGPIKRKDLIRHLKQPDLKVPTQAANTNSWSAATSPFDFRTRIRVTLASSFWPESCVKQGSTEMSGKRSEKRNFCLSQCLIRSFGSDFP
jgi:hypothetical protein